MGLRWFVAPDEKRNRPDKHLYSGGPIAATAKRRTSPRTISIIIPAYNEEAYLGLTLAALKRQRYLAREIIVVANGCTDGTVAVARGRCNRLVVLPEKQLGVARNLGARMATGEMLAFLDADTILEPDALAKIAGQFSHRDAAGTLRGEPDSDRFSYRLIYRLKNFIHRWLVRNGSSGIILCWKSDFIRAGGFDESLEIRENSDLVRRLKRYGKYRYVADAAAVTSMRRYNRHGVGRIAWLWCKLWVRSLVQDLRHQTYEPVR